MAKTVSDLNDLPLTQETPSMQTIDMFNSYMNAPVVKKLDADEYMANDLDGVTEGLLGSGNLNFLMMQAGQTDEAMANSGGDININGDSFFAASFTDPRLIPFSENASGADTSMDRGFDMPSLSPENGGFINESSSSAARLLGASNQVSNSKIGQPYTDTSSEVYGQSAVNGNNGNNGSNGTSGNGNNGNSGTNGTNGTNGLNGLDGTGGGDTYNEYYEYNETTIININELGLGPVGISLDATLDNLSNLTLDVISGDNIINVLDETLNLSPVLEPIDGLVGDILANVSLDVILNPFQYDSSPDDFDLQVGTDVEILGLTLPDLGLDIPLDPIEGLIGDIDASLDVGEILAGFPLLGGGGNNPDTNIELAEITDIPALAPVVNLVDGLIDPGEDLAGDIDVLGNLHLDLLGIGQDTAGADTDITLPVDLDILSNDIVNETFSVALDPLENVIGDVDLDLTVAGNILGDVADGLIDSDNGGTGSGFLSDLGDTIVDLVDAPLEPVLDDLNLSGNVVVELLDPLANNGSILDIDFIQTLSSDVLSNPETLLDTLMETVDNTLDTAIDLLDNIPTNTGGLDLGVLLPGESNGDDLTSPVTSWTETLIPDAGNLLGDGLLSGVNDLIPDPVSIIPALTLPTIPVIPVLPTGGGHHGGLFGGGGLFG